LCTERALEGFGQLGLYGEVHNAGSKSSMIQSLFYILSRYNPLMFEFTIINIFKVSSDIISYEEYA